MTYENELLKGSYDGVAFLLTEESAMGGQRIQQTSSSSSKGIKYSNTFTSSGIMAKKFNIKMIINEKALGVNLKDHLKRLIDKLELATDKEVNRAEVARTNTLGLAGDEHNRTLYGKTLILPALGVFPKMVCGEWTVNHSLEAIGEVSITTTFFEVQNGEDLDKDSPLSIAVQSLKKMNDAIIDYKSEFTKTTNPDQYIRMSGQVRELVGQLVSIPQMSLPIISAYNTITNNLRVFLSNPESMTDYVSQAYTTIDEEEPDYEDRSQYLKQMDLKPASTYASAQGNVYKENNKRLETVHTLFLTPIFLMACKVAVNRAYVLKKEVDEEMQFLTSLLELLGNPDTLQDIYAAVGNILGQLALNTFEIVDYFLPTATTSLELSYRILGDTRYSPYLEALNSSQSPYQMVGKVKVIV